MSEKKDVTHYNLKGLFKYISTVISWTIFVLLIIVGILLLYYYISVRLYATKGEKYEPKFSVYTIVSGSMEPTISVYDVIINTTVDSIKDVKVNDVVTFISTWNVTQGMTITHRVVGTKTLDDGSTCLITRGDNNTQEDTTCVTESNLIGVTKAVIPGLGKIQFFLASKLGWLCLIIIPALYIIIKDIFKLIKMSKDNKKKKNEVNERDIRKDEFDDTRLISIVDASNESSINEENNEENNAEITNETDNINLEAAYKELLEIKEKNEDSKE